MIFIIFVYIIFFFLLSFRRLDWAVLIIIAALPSYLVRFQIFGVPFTLLETMILISFGVWLIKNYKKILENLKLKFQNEDWKLKINNNYPFQWEIILLLVISYIAAGVAGFSNSALGIWKAYFFEPILFYLVIINVFKAKDLGKIVGALAVSALIVSLLAVWQKITGQFTVPEFWQADSKRVTSFFGYPNAAGLYLGPIILILVGWLLNRIIEIKKQIVSCQLSVVRKLIFIAAALSLSFLAVYFAESEGAVIGVAVGLIFFGWLGGSKVKAITAVLFILALVGIISYAPARDYAVKKFTLTDFSGQVRKLQWAETWAMLEEGRMITGAGLANYQQAIAPYHQEGFFYNKDNDPDFHRKTVFNAEYRAKVWQPLEIYLYPHNIFLNFWSELGLAGMLLFIWIIGKFFYIVLKIIENCKLKVENSKVINHHTLTAGRNVPWQDEMSAPRAQGVQGVAVKSKYVASGLMGAIVVIVVHGLVDVPYFKNDLAAMFWIIIAMIGMLDLESKKRKLHL